MNADEWALLGILPVDDEVVDVELDPGKVSDDVNADIETREFRLSVREAKADGFSDRMIVEGCFCHTQHKLAIANELVSRRGTEIECTYSSLGFSLILVQGLLV